MALPAQVGEIELFEQGRHLAFLDRVEEMQVVEAGGAGQLLQTSLVGAAAHQDEGERLGAHQAGGLEQAVERVGQAVGAGVADDAQAALAQGGQRAAHAMAQRGPVALPLARIDAVGDDMQLARGQAVQRHVLLDLGQDRHHAVGVPIGVVLGRLEQHDEGMPARHVPQFHRRQRPQVVHFEQQARAGAARDALGRPDVERIGTRGDHQVGPDGVGQPVRLPHQGADEGQHVAHPAQAVAGVGRGREPAVVDPVDVLVEPGPPRHRRLRRAQVGVGGGQDAHPVPALDPFARQVIGTEFHPVAGRAGVVVDEQDIHGASSGGGYQARPSTRRRTLQRVASTQFVSHCSGWVSRQMLW